MINVRKSEERGHNNFGWLDTYHTFSFGDYYDPDNMGFRSLRVINEDQVKGGAGFGSHPHRDMEIITYVMDGALRHEDNFGHNSVIKKDYFQKMSAGTGIIHSEYNDSETETVHLYQIWILPDHKGIKPNYGQVHIKRSEIENRLMLIASSNKDVYEAPIHIHQDARLYIAKLDNSAGVSHKLENNRYAWIQVTKGSVKILGKNLEEGDGAAVSGETEINISPKSYGEFLLFDLA